MSPRELVERWVERFNAADADGLAALYHPDAINHQVTQDPGFFTVRDGRIAFQRGYWDRLSFLKAHGLPIA